MANKLVGSTEGNTLTLSVKVDRIDAASAREFKSEALEMVVASTETVVVDMEPVDFIDSSGIGALLSIQKKLGPKKNPLKLVRMKPQVQSVIELLRLHRVFEIAQ